MSATHEARARRLFAPQRSNGQMTTWHAKVRTAMDHAHDHPDADLVRRLDQMLEQQVAELERMVEEAETHAMRVALEEAVTLCGDAAGDAMCSPVCVLDAWEAEREARRHGDMLDARRG